MLSPKNAGISWKRNNNRIGTQNVLFDPEVFGLLGYMGLIGSLFIGICNMYIYIYIIGIILAHEKRFPK